jgi:hypothetical protein
MWSRDLLRGEETRARVPFASSFVKSNAGRTLGPPRVVPTTWAYCSGTRVMVNRSFFRPGLIVSRV